MYYTTLKHIPQFTSKPTTRNKVYNTFQGNVLIDHLKVLNAKADMVRRRRLSSGT